MSDNKRYNGWTNYETWNFALWLGNDYGSYEYWQEQTRDAYRHAQSSSSFSRSEQAALDLAHMLQNEIEENTPTVTGFYADVLNTAISEVNWYEITEHWIDDLDKDEEGGE